MRLAVSQFGSRFSDRLVWGRSMTLSARDVALKKAELGEASKFGTLGVHSAEDACEREVAAGHRSSVAEQVGASLA
jgi:hypothetical protein